MSEFDLINRLDHIINDGKTDLVQLGSIGIGDDAAILSIDAGNQLVVTMDTLVPGVHFPLNASAADIGYKSLAVNLSDLAAMGSKPMWIFLSLCLPERDQEWLDDFAQGMASLVKTYQLELAGGDTTSGPLTITITAMGQVAYGQSLLRSGAQKGDLVVISGTPGLAAYGLWQWQNNEVSAPEVRRALTRPSPRLELGQLLAGLATACIDISDGLAADLGHICDASGLGAEIHLDRLPITDALSELANEARWDFQLGGGDDYELCFTLPKASKSHLARLSERVGVKLSVIGEMTDQPRVQFLNQDGSEFLPQRSGYNHFPDPNC